MTVLAVTTMTMTFSISKTLPVVGSCLLVLTGANVANSKDDSSIRSSMTRNLITCVTLKAQDERHTERIRELGQSFYGFACRHRTINRQSAIAEENMDIEEKEYL